MARRGGAAYLRAGRRQEGGGQRAGEGGVGRAPARWARASPRALCRLLVSRASGRGRAGGGKAERGGALVVCLTTPLPALPRCWVVAAGTRSLVTGPGGAQASLPAGGSCHPPTWGRRRSGAGDGLQAASLTTCRRADQAQRPTARNACGPTPHGAAASSATRSAALVALISTCTIHRSMRWRLPRRPSRGCKPCAPSCRVSGDTTAADRNWRPAAARWLPLQPPPPPPPPPAAATRSCCRRGGGRGPA